MKAPSVQVKKELPTPREEPKKIQISRIIKEREVVGRVVRPKVEKRAPTIGEIAYRALIGEKVPAKLERKHFEATARAVGAGAVAGVVAVPTTVISLATKPVETVKGAIGGVVTAVTHPVATVAAIGKQPEYVAAGLVTSYGVGKGISKAVEKITAKQPQVKYLVEKRLEERNAMQGRLSQVSH